jgi:hypothetical protein
MGELRPELVPPRLDTAKIERLTRLAEEIIDLINARREFRPLLARFNVEAGTELTPGDFLASAGAMETRDFVERALMPKPGRVANITYDELLEVMTRVCEAQGSDSDIQFWIDLLQAHVPYRSVWNLIYWPFGCPPPDDAPSLTPKELLDAALANRPPAISPHVARPFRP